MAKKKDFSIEDVVGSILQNSQNKHVKKWEKKDLEKIFSNIDPLGMSDDDRRLMIAAAIFMQNGITPDTYTTLYEMAKDNPIVNMLPVNLLFPGSQDSEEEFDDGEDDFPRERRFSALTGFPMPNASEKTLVLKIQLRGIKKPPLWREVKIPADFNFMQLHEVIQILFGWTNSHMWQFEKTPYSQGYNIGMEMEDMGFGEGPTDIADQTPITRVLKNPKDKMVYVYDFGDDWVHDISVKEVIDEKSDYPVCIAWKSDNPMEDIGGIWGLEEFRNMADPEVKHTKKEEKEFLDNTWFDSMKEFHSFMKHHKFNLNEVNEELKTITR